MIHFTLSKAAALLNLNTELSGEFTGVSIDTRTLTPGNLFIAIKGERVDGFDFIAQAEKSWLRRYFDRSSVSKSFTHFTSA